ncbi:MAG: hypothetical protein ACLS3M_11870 [Collinsella sp.]
MRRGLTRQTLSRRPGTSTSGIDVYTTINVQHIEPKRHVCIHHRRCRERRIPTVSSMMPTRSGAMREQDLLERLRAGLVYRPAQADRAQQHFYRREPHHTREIALRRCANPSATSQMPHACWKP